MDPSFNNVNFFRTNFFARYQPLAMPAAAPIGFTKVSPAGGDRFMGTSPLAIAHGYDPNPAPFDGKTGFYPNFNNTNNLRAHMQHILLSNPKFATDIDPKVSVKSIIQILDSPPETAKDNIKQLSNTLSKYGFKDNDIVKLARLGGISIVNDIVNDLNRKFPDSEPDSVATQRKQAVLGIKNNLIRKYEKIDPPPASV